MLYSTLRHEYRIVGPRALGLLILLSAVTGCSMSKEPQTGPGKRSGLSATTNGTFRKVSLVDWETVAVYALANDRSRTAACF